MNGVYELTLRTSDGRERHELVWLPNEDVRRDFYEKAKRNGLEIIEDNVSPKLFSYDKESSTKENARTYQTEY